MTILSNSTGSQTCVIGTEHFIASPNTVGRFQPILDVNLMASGDVLELRAYKMAIAGGTSRQLWVHVLYGAQSINPILIGNWVANELTDTNAVRFSIKQTFGTGRVIPWDVLRETNQVDVTTWNGTTVATPLTSGVPRVDIARIYGDLGAADSLRAWFTSATTGMATAGTATTISLGAGLLAVADSYLGWTIAIYSGTGAGQARLITGYTAARVATVHRNWETTPDGTSYYVLVPVGQADVETWMNTAVTASAAGVPDVNVKKLGNVLQTGRDLGTSVLLSAGEHTLIVDDVRNAISVQRGTAQAGAASTITLATGASATDSLYNNAPVTIVSGTGAGQTRYITAYVGATKVATVDAAWATNPDATSVYEITVEARYTAGGTGLDAAATRAALGMASANMDTQLGAIKTKTDQLVFTVLNQVDVNVVDWKGAVAPAMSGDAFARLGAAGAGLTALGDTRIANLDAAISTRSTYAGGAVASVTAAVDITQGAADKVWATTTRALTDKVGFALSSAGVLAIWDVLLTAILTVGSVGKVIKDNLDAAISSRSTYAGGAVASVTGAVGSVTGNVGGNVVGSVGSVAGNVVGSVASVTADVGITQVGADKVWGSAARTLTAFGFTVSANLAQILGTALTETTGGFIAAAFKKFFNIGTPASTMDALTLVATATNLTNAATNGDLTATMKTSEATAVQTGMTAQGYTAARAAFLDTLNGLVAAIWASTTRILTAGTNIVLAKGTGVTGFNDLSATGVENAVWDATMASHVAAGSTGTKLNSAGSAGDPWSTALPGAYGAGSAGNILGNRLDVAVSTRSTVAAIWAAVVDSAGVTALLARLTALRAGYLDNLATAPSTPASVLAAFTQLTGTAVAGAVSYINLGASASAANNIYRESLLYIESGTGAGQRRYITTYDGTTKIADISPNWDVAPDNTSVYRIFIDSGNGPSILDAATLHSIWEVDPGSFFAGQLGYQIAVNLDTTITSRATAAGVWAAATRTLTAVSDSAGITTLLSRISAAITITSGKVDVSDKTGFSLSTAGVQAIWDVLLTAILTAGTIGKLIKDNLDAAISTRSTYAGTDTAGTTTLLSRIGAAITITAGKIDVNDKTGFALSTAGVKAIWDQAMSALTTIGSAGKLLADFLDAAVSTRLPTSGYTAPTTPPTVIAIRTEMDTNSTKLANLDVAVSTRSTVAAIWAAVVDSAGTTTLLARLTAIRAGLLDNLDAAISSRSTYAGTDTAGTTTLLARLTAIRAGLLDNLDAAISSRLSAAGYTAPLDATGVRAAVGLATANLDTQLSGINSKTTNLPTDPADASDVAAAISAVQAHGDLSWLTATGFATPANVTTAQTTILAKLLKYVQLTLRKDAAIVTDNATEVTAINASGGSGVGVYDSTTDSQEAIRDRGDVAWLSGVGGGGGATPADIWDYLTSNGTTLGSMGKLLVDNLDAKVSTRSTYAGTDTAGVTTLLSRLTATRAGLLDFLDVAISSRSTYAGGDTTGTATLLARLTAIRAGLLDNLDAAISSRSTYAGTDTAGTATLLARLTAIRAGLIDNLDAAISTRMAAASYVAPTTPPTAVAIRTEMDSNSTKLALLDVAVSTRSTYAGTDTAGTTTLLARLTAIRAAALDLLDIAISTRMATFVYTPADNAGITAIKAKTDALPSDPADESLLIAAIAALNNVSPAQVQTAAAAALLAYDAATGAEISALQTHGDLFWEGSGVVDLTPISIVTDKLATMLQPGSGGASEFTVEALEQGPGGGGSSPVAIWTYPNRSLTLTGQTVVHQALDPVTLDLMIIPGDTYSVGLNNTPIWEDSGDWPNLTGATITMVVEKVNGDHRQFTFALALLLSPQRVRLSLTSTDSGKLSAEDAYTYHIVATLADAVSVRTLAVGNLVAENV